MYAGLLSWLNYFIFFDHVSLYLFEQYCFFVYDNKPTESYLHNLRETIIVIILREEYINISIIGSARVIVTMLSNEK